MLIVRCPSSSPVKITAIRRALAAALPEREFEVLALPVELQDRPDLEINAQPEGEEQTVQYVHQRRAEMCRQHGDSPAALDITIESGAIDGMDVAVVMLQHGNQEVIVQSVGVPFPIGTLEAARERGCATTTAGDIIHEWYQLPANNWHESFPPGISRQMQICNAVIDGLHRLQL